MADLAMIVPFWTKWTVSGLSLAYLPGRRSATPHAAVRREGRAPNWRDAPLLSPEHTFRQPANDGVRQEDGSLSLLNRHVRVVATAVAIVLALP